MANLYYTFTENTLCMENSVNYLTAESFNREESMIERLYKDIADYKDGNSTRDKELLKAFIFSTAKDLARHEAREKVIEKHKKLIDFCCDELERLMPSGTYTTRDTYCYYLFEQHKDFCNVKTYTTYKGEKKETVQRPRGLSKAVLERMVKNGKMTKIFDALGCYYVMN